MLLVLLGGCVTATSTSTQTDPDGAAQGVGTGSAATNGYMDAQERELRERLAEPLAGATVSVMRNRDDILLTVAGQATFQQDLADLTPELQKLLGTLAGVLGRYQDTVIEVSGFTDASGPMITNMALSLERAEGVARQLVELGIEADRIVAKGLGPLLPIGDNDTPEGRQSNRRVELVIRPR